MTGFFIHVTNQVILGKTRLRNNAAGIAAQSYLSSNDFGKLG